MKIIDKLMKRMAVAVFFCLLFLGALLPTCAAQPRDPRSEIELRTNHKAFLPPPVNEVAASRAEHASRSRSRTASISDQVELAIKRGNAAMIKLDDDKEWISGPRLTEDEKLRLRAQAESNYQRALKLNPKDWRAFTGLGNVYSYEHRYADAASAYERAVSLRPNDSDLQIVLGDYYDSGDKTADAIRAYARSLELDPSAKNEIAYSRLAMVYQREGLIDEAIQTYKQLLVVKPDEEWAYTPIAGLYEKQKKYEEALEAYKHQIRLHPNQQYAHEELGDSYMTLRRFAEAVDAYEAELRVFPKNIGAVLKIGEALLETHDIQKAREKQKELAKLEREVFSAATGLSEVSANLLMEHIKLAEEIEQMRQAQQANPTDSAPHFGTGNAYLEWTYRDSRSGKINNHYSEAIEQYKEAIRLAPESPAARFNLGLAYLYNGDKSAAMDQYHALKQLKPDYAEELLNAINKR